MNTSFAEYRLLNELKFRRSILEWIDGLYELLDTIPPTSPIVPGITAAILSGLQVLQQRGLTCK